MKTEEGNVETKCIKLVSDIGTASDIYVADGQVEFL
jgi:hypothetical protein